MLTDGQGRRITYLRLSVTDRCNLRCNYCMPNGHAAYERKQNRLTFEEIDRLVRLFVAEGISRVRVTGGEPLVRADVVDLLRRIGSHAALSDLSVSTNGTRLGSLAGALKEAGVRRLNVSLDTLSPLRFQQLTGRDALDQVLAGLSIARRVGFDLVKLNMVWLPGFNDDELERMIDYCVVNGFVLRLIERMPSAGVPEQSRTNSLSAALHGLKERYGLVDALLPGGGPARYLSTPDSSFTVGFITPVSQHFCDSCNRIRLTADGKMHLCLGQEDYVDFRTLLRSGCSDFDLVRALHDGLGRKPARHSFMETKGLPIRRMSSLGG